MSHLPSPNLSEAIIEVLLQEIDDPTDPAVLDDDMLIYVIAATAEEPLNVRRNRRKRPRMLQGTGVILSCGLPTTAESWCLSYARSHPT
jgi:hypothetical protein